MSGYLYRPSGTGPSPAIVLLHGGGGIERYNLEWASWLASLGYVALAVDSGKLTPSQTIITHAIGAAGYLRSLSFVAGDRLGIMGFSRGGAAALNAVTLREAAAPEFRAAILLYPAGCSYQIKSTSVPLLLLLGERDGSPEPCTDMTKRLSATSSVPVTLVLYPNAYHAFDNPEIRALTSIPWMPAVGLLYDERATSDAHEKVRQFFAQHVGIRQ